MTQVNEPKTPTPLGIAVVTVSDSRTIDTDKSGGLLVDFIEGAGHQLTRREIVLDDLDTIRETVRGLCKQSEVDVICVTGGTGITGRDVTPEALQPLIDKLLPGFGELFRWLSYEDIGAATIQSRALGAVCDKTLVFALPGSTNAVGLAIDKILRPQLDVRTRPCNFAQLLPRLREGD